MDFQGIGAIIFLSIISIVYAYFKYAFGYWKSKGILYDEPSFPFGSLRSSGTIADRMKDIYDKYKPSGAKLVGGYVFATPMAIVLDLELIKNIFIKDFAQFDDRDVYHNEVDDPLSAHLIRVDGEKWRSLRTKLSPMFSSGKMKMIFPIIAEIGERFRACLLDAAVQHRGDDGLEIRDWCSRFVIDTMGTCALGVKCDTLNDPNGKFRQIACRTGLNERHGVVTFTILSTFQNLARKFHAKSVSDDVSEFLLKVLGDTIDYRQKNNIRQMDFLDLMIRLKESDDKEKALTFNEIAAQVYLFFGAGHDSGAAVLAFSLYELSKNPDIQTKATSIIDAAFEKYNGKMTYEMIMDLPYIDQIIKETLRMYPVPFSTRKAKNDYAVPGTDIVIDKGTRLIIPTYGLHFDPSYYASPEQFDPSRFGSDQQNKCDSLPWLAFGSGPRVCIAQRFATLQTKVGLVFLLKNFRFSLGSKTNEPLSMNIKSFFLSPKDGIYLKVKPLHG